MIELCELFNIIPKEKIDHVFQSSQTAGAECGIEFLGFEEVYKAVMMFVPKRKVIIDCGCAHAFQSWYFRDYQKYIGIDCALSINDVLETENSEFYFVTIQHFIKKVFPTLGHSLDDVFVVCSYVPDGEAREMVRNFFPHCLVYYPTRTGSRFYGIDYRQRSS